MIESTFLFVQKFSVSRVRNIALCFFVYLYDEIHEFRVLELRNEMNVYVPRSFLALVKQYGESRPEKLRPTFSLLLKLR